MARPPRLGADAEGVDGSRQRRIAGCIDGSVRNRLPAKGWILPDGTGRRPEAWRSRRVGKPRGRRPGGPSE